MEIKYIVHSCTTQDFAAIANLNGRDVEVNVNGLVVELVSADGTMNRTIRVMPNDIAAAQELYEVGATIITTDTKETL